MDKKYFVYIHYRADDSTPFYVGKGSNKRDRVRAQRSQWWKSIVRKHGYYIERVFSTDYEEEAFNRERSLIATLRALGMLLCNISSGGDGASGYKRSKECVDRISAKQRGVPRPWQVGHKHQRFLGEIVATEILTGKTITISGNQQMKDLGLNPSNVCKCLKGKRPSHKGYTFTR
jgi:hypothetical protein